MAAHNLNDERTGVRKGSRVDVVDGFADAVEGSRRADSHIGQCHVVVDGTNESDDAKVSLKFDLLRSNFSYSLMSVES